MQDLTNVVECYSCGLFVQKSNSSKFTQRCPRCDSKLKEENSHSIDSLFFAISSLMLFLILQRRNYNTPLRFCQCAVIIKITSAEGMVKP